MSRITNCTQHIDNINQFQKPDKRIITIHLHTYIFNIYNINNKQTKKLHKRLFIHFYYNKEIEKWSEKRESKKLTKNIIRVEFVKNEKIDQGVDGSKKFGDPCFNLKKKKKNPVSCNIQMTFTY